MKSHAMGTSVFTFILAGLLGGTAIADGEKVPIYEVTIVGRTTTAINYRQHRTSDVEFIGTPLMSDAKGEAKVRFSDGTLAIDAEFEGMRWPMTFGNEYLTYVLWAITPEGRPTNIGELVRDGERSEIHATTELQVFGMIVTAEPYFAVSQPSDVVVLENVAGSDKLQVEPVSANFELLKRGQYTLNMGPGEPRAVLFEKGVPLDLYEARNAVAIARAAGADKLASESWQKAANELRNAESLQSTGAAKSKVVMTARQAVQTAEDSRLIAVDRQAKNLAAGEKQAAAGREQAAAEREEDAKADADRQRAVAENERLRAEVELARGEAGVAAAQEQARAGVAAAQQQSRADVAAVQEQSRVNEQRLAEEKRVAEAKAGEQRLADSKQLAEADAARTQAEQDRLAAERARGAAGVAAAQEQARIDAERVRLQGEQERGVLRGQLREQLNVILETKDTVRGLIVNLSDVVFDTGKSTLRPGAREMLAKLSGIINAHPGLTLVIEGHTDSVGGDEMNAALSQRRALAVRDYLVTQGVQGESIRTAGFGESQPVASNDAAAGRQMNRRVEIVVAGDVIGGSGSPAR